MSYFDHEFEEFFVELEENNSKTWFDANRKRYENHVKAPFKAFVSELIDKIGEFDPKITIEPKNAIFRINRDIRFSKDKTPYKIHMAAAFGRSKRKEVDFAGYYVHVSPHYVYVGGGSYFLDKNGIQAIRETIAENPQKFHKVINNKSFLTKYGEVLGDRLKRVPKPFNEIVEKIPEIANKQFYYSADLDPPILTSSSFTSTILEYYKTGYPLNQFLREALQRER